MDVTVNRALSMPLLRVMTFLNEATQACPSAISFAPGRPAERFFDMEGALQSFSRYADHAARASGAPRADVVRGLGQYAHTSGIIRELLARYLEKDEGIRAGADAIVVTSGAQEAMSLVLQGLFDPRRDVLLVTDPGYIGITGSAALLGIDMHPVANGDQGLDLDALVACIERVRASGKRPKALYDIPDFHNPLGTTLPLEARRRLLDIAHANGMLVIEDNPYGILAYEDTRLPTLKALDERRDVIYIGTFSKSLFPGLRLGYMVADQPVAGDPSVPSMLLAHELSKVKSLVTVNTSPLLQAIVGGILIENDFSLLELNRPKIQFYKSNRDKMLACLEQSFGKDPMLAGSVQWNRPRGGLFITMKLPFPFGEDQLWTCAREYGVICCPMSFFSLTRGTECQIRLSFSYVSEDEIERGVGSLLRFVRDTVTAEQARA